MQKLDHDIGLWEKCQFFRRKLSKIAENCDHNINPCNWCYLVKISDFFFSKNMLVFLKSKRKEVLEARLTYDPFPSKAFKNIWQKLHFTNFYVELGPRTVKQTRQVKCALIPNWLPKWAELIPNAPFSLSVCGRSWNDICDWNFRYSNSQLHFLNTNSLYSAENLYPCVFDRQRPLSQIQNETELVMAVLSCYVRGKSFHFQNNDAKVHIHIHLHICIIHKMSIV
jgi:hypothetical protein